MLCAVVPDRSCGVQSTVLGKNYFGLIHDYRSSFFRQDTELLKHELKAFVKPTPHICGFLYAVASVECKRELWEV